jgi:hypothetical protein
MKKPTPPPTDHSGHMAFLAQQIDHLFNGDLRGQDRTTGFLLMVFPFGAGERRARFVSNAANADTIPMLKEAIALLEMEASHEPENHQSGDL